MEAIILGILAAIEHLAPLGAKLIAAGQQTGELSPEKVAELRGKMEAAFGSARWQPDKQA